ncbi:hypothetical protein PGT21_008285 [Puccinia graminis f. sp. tritici]|uniref:Alginate lyase domain-containing protein n=1 Tax=Puccinia graminis f. sp. tritici TaxID=56615 RepID=A0A5B0NRU5_PUCGR|nr:hypothetical protein PGTUg99_025335 [Puccinia graminis f. sp. tritici]KAA1090639.1 hypothetical protein PGT21_008285 [Puccinia graminis f. sp. tritici]
MLPPSPTTAVKYPDRSDLRLRQGRGQLESQCNCPPGSAQHYLLNLTSGNASPSSQLQCIHSLSQTYNQNNNSATHGTDLRTSSPVSAIQSVGSYQPASLYDRPGTSSLFQTPGYVDLSIHGISPSSFSVRGLTRKNSSGRDGGSYHESFKAHQEDAPKNIGFFGVSLMDYEIVDSLDSSASESSLLSQSNSAPESSDSGEEPDFPRLDDSFDSFDSSWSQIHSDGIGAHIHSHSLNKSQRQAKDEFRHGFVSEMCGRKASRWDRRIQLELTRQERRRIRQLVFFAASFIISTLFLFGIIMINIDQLSYDLDVSTGPTHMPIPIIEAPERDALIIYRIIGNDLPPRHSPKQTLTNLQFLLEHEGDFEEISRYVNAESDSDSDRDLRGYKLRVKKFFVLNRIANQTQLSLVKNILKVHGVEEGQILVNPFVTDAYRSQPFNALPDIGWDSGLHSTWGIDKEAAESATIPKAIEEQNPTENSTSSYRGSNSDRWRALDFTYHAKNLYAMNNNGGRNFALEHGRTIPEARWILPLDGNCFFTPASLFSLASSLRDSDLQPDPPSHVIIPMSRLLDNEQAVAQNEPINLKERGFRPQTRDEPQIGFRFTSTEIYSPDMRYGRRSKLELLWRLGAIDRGRNLDKKIGDWEVMEKNILTSKSYGTIRRTVQSTPATSHHRARNHPVEGSPDYIRAGWVLRLFSGDQSQEEHSEKARSRRSVNRMKGIISFLESIDESIARGPSSCDQGRLDENCGFADWRLWSLNGDELEKMKLQHINKDPSVRPLVDKLVQLSENFVTYASAILSKGPNDVARSVDIPAIPNTIFILALTAYFTDDEKCADMAASLTNMVFLQSRLSLRPNAFPVTLNTQLQSLRLQSDYDGSGYAFPIPRHENALPNWVKDTTLEHIPFNPYTFDPTLLLDGIRLLWNDWRTSSDKPQSKWLQQSIREKIPKQKLQELFTLQISYLLLNDTIAQDFFTRNSNEVEGMNYVLKLSALASFTDDVRLLNRIWSRTPVEMSLLSKTRTIDPEHSNTALIFAEEVPADFATLYQRFRTGFHNIKLHPFLNSSTQKIAN